jgi:hypothetical protein
VELELLDDDDDPPWPPPPLSTVDTMQPRPKSPQSEELPPELCGCDCVGLAVWP